MRSRRSHRMRRNSRSGGPTAVMRCAPRAATTPREWVDLWRGWLAAAGWPGSRALDSAEFQAREAWEKLLVQFASLGAVAPRLGARAAIGALHAMANETLFQPEGQQCAGPDSGRAGRRRPRLDALWVAGLSADLTLRRRVPIPCCRSRGNASAACLAPAAQRELEYARVLTERFARAADEVVFSSATGRRRSTAIAVGPGACASSRRRRCPCPKRGLPRWRGAQPRKPRRRTRAADASGVATRGGARAIQTQSDCPFQAVARHRLGAQAWPTAGSGLAPLERGQLAHARWPHSGARSRDWATAPGARSRSVSTSRLRRQSKRDGLPAPNGGGAACPTRVRAAESRRLNRLLRAWLDIERARPPFAVAAVEARRDAGARRHRVFSMRVDRIDAPRRRRHRDHRLQDRRAQAAQAAKMVRRSTARIATRHLHAGATRSRAPSSRCAPLSMPQLRTAGVAASGIAADRAAWPALTTVAAAPAPLPTGARSSLGGSASRARSPPSSRPEWRP